MFSRLKTGAVLLFALLLVNASAQAAVCDAACAASQGACHGAAGEGMHMAGMHCGMAMTSRAQADARVAAVCHAPFLAPAERIAANSGAPATVGAGVDVYCVRPMAQLAARGDSADALRRRVPIPSRPRQMRV